MEQVRVETLAKVTSEVPLQYIQLPENRLNTKELHQCDGNIPMIDFSSFDKIHLGAVKEAIGHVCRDWGAFYVTNHGVRTELVEQMKEVGISFFKECSMDQKLKYAREPNSAASEGYGSRMLHGTDKDVVLDWRDYFDHHTFPLSRRKPSSWPDYPPTYRKVVGEYADEMKALASKLLGLMSENLGLPSSCIEDAVGEFYQNITVSYYPPCPQPELTLGLQSHSDMGALTLLTQDDVGGLQLLKDGKWVTVSPMPNAILVIVADQTEIITNGAYKSAQHRAITNADRARLSIATFHDPAKTMEIAPASQLVKSSPPRYRGVVYGHYVSSWYSKGPEGKQNLDTLRL